MEIRPKGKQRPPNAAYIKALENAEVSSSVIKKLHEDRVKWDMERRERTATILKKMDSYLATPLPSRKQSLAEKVHNMIPAIVYGFFALCVFAILIMAIVAML